MQEASEKSLRKACDEARQKETGLYEEIRKLEIVCASLENEKGRAERESKSVQFTYDRLCETSKQEQNDLHDQLIEAKKECAMAKAAQDRLSAQLKAANDNVQHMQTQGKRERQNIDSRIEELVASLKSRREEADGANERVSSLEIMMEELRRERDHDARLREGDLQQLQDQVVALQRSKDMLSEEMGRRLKEAIESRDHEEHRANQSVHERESLAERWRAEHRSSSLKYQRSIRELKDEALRLLQRNQSLEAKIASFVKDREETQRRFDAHNKVFFFQHSCCL